MRRVLLGIVGCYCVLGAGLSFGAEALKMRQIASVYVDSKGVGLNLPEGVGCSETTLVVADSGNGRLLRFVVQEGSTRGSEELKVPEAPYPIRVHLNGKGEIFVLDGKARRVARLGAKGEFLGFLDVKGAEGSAPVVRSFSLDKEGNIYLLDVFSGRVLVVDTQGKYLRQIAFPKEYGFISDVAVDSRGVVYALDSVNAVVYTAARDAAAFAPLTKKMKEYINFPTNLVVDARGGIYVADQNSGGVVVLGSDGSFRARHASYGWKDGLLRYPAQLCTTESGLVYVADRDNNRVLTFTTAK